MYTHIENYSRCVMLKGSFKYDVYGYETAKALYDVAIRQTDGHRIYLVDGITSFQMKRHKTIENYFDIKPKLENTDHDPITKTEATVR